MASQASGRGRDPAPRGPLDRPSLLIQDYLETGQFPGRPVRGRRRRRRLRKLGSGVRRLTADGRVLAVAAIVAGVLAVLVGTSLPLHSTQAGPGRPSAGPGMASRSPGTPAAPSLAQPTGTSPSARPSARSTASPGEANPGGTSPGGTSPGAARSNGGGSRQARPAASTGPSAGRPVSSAAATRRAAQVAPAVSAVVVTFSVSSRGAGIFQGEVKIVNDGTKPLANWQVAVALPGDRVVAIANASALVVQGILLLEPASGAAPVPARGGVLNVFFVAVGSQPISGACTFNQLPCS